MKRKMLSIVMLLVLLVINLALTSCGDTEKGKTPAQTVGDAAAAPSDPNSIIGHWHGIISDHETQDIFIDTDGTYRWVNFETENDEEGKPYEVIDEEENGFYVYYPQSNRLVAAIYEDGQLEGVFEGYVSINGSEMIISYEYTNRTRSYEYSRVLDAAIVPYSLPQSTSQLVGVWEGYDSEGQLSHIELFADGTGKGSYKARNGDIAWMANDMRHTLAAVGSYDVIGFDDKNFDYGSMHFEVTGNELRITDDGTYSTYDPNDKSLAGFFFPTVYTKVG